MKQICILLLIFLPSFSNGQIDKINETKNLDFSTLSNNDTIIYASDASFENNKVVTIFDKIVRSRPLGFIGDNYQRFYIHFDKVFKNINIDFEYLLKGKTKVKTNICSFSGKFRLTSFKKIESSSRADYETFRLRGEYIFNEDSTCYGAGTFSGTFYIDCFFNEKNEILYNSIDFVSDGFSNNGFIGTWTSYKTKKSKKCNWGDYRIPNSGDLDIGVGEFSVNKKYRQFGWETYYKAWGANTNSEESIAAREIESNEWWK